VRFSVQSIRRDLDLTTGDSAVYQSGGSYGKIRRELATRRIIGYEVHHIPSKAVVKRWGSTYSLPAIALLKEDHAKTDSFRYKSRIKHESFLPDVAVSSSYIDQAKERIGVAQLFELIRIELLNIRDQCGHKYDGAISQYLDALEAYILKHDYPQL